MPKRTAITIRNLSAGVHCDGGGLVLIVKRSGSCSWVLRVTRDGTRRDIGLESSPGVTLAQAREKAVALRGEVKAGDHPLEARREAR